MGGEKKKKQVEGAFAPVQRPVRAEAGLRDCFVGVTKPKGQENSSPDEGFSLLRLSARSLTCTFDCRLGHIFSANWGGKFGAHSYLRARSGRSLAPLTETVL